MLPARKTPWVAILFTTALGVILVSTGDLGDLADTTVFLLLCVFTIVNISVLVLRKDEVEHKHFHAPSLLPVLGALVCIFLITQTEGEVIVRGGIILLVGAALYLVSEFFRRREGRGAGRDRRQQPGRLSGRGARPASSSLGRFRYRGTAPMAFANRHDFGVPQACRRPPRLRPKPPSSRRLSSRLDGPSRARAFAFGDLLKAASACARICVAQTSLTGDGERARPAAVDVAGQTASWTYFLPGTS